METETKSFVVYHYISLQQSLNISWKVLQYKNYRIDRNCCFTLTYFITDMLFHIHHTICFIVLSVPMNMQGPLRGNNFALSPTLQTYIFL
jgi:hypothetical protein